MFVLTIYHLILRSEEEHVYCVNPSSDTLRCNDSQYLCEDLRFYTSNVSLYFTDDTVFEFLPGEHKLDGGLSVTVAELKNLRLTGETVNCFPAAALKSHGNDLPPQITCTGEGAVNCGGGFIFRNIENLTLSVLSITGCGQVVPSSIYDQRYGEAKAALAFGTVRNLHLQSLTVNGSSGYGILTHNIRGRSLVEGCDFSSNRGSAKFRGGNAHFNFSDCDAYECDVTELVLKNSRFSFGGYHGDYEDLNRTGTLATGISVLLACTNITVLLDNVTANNNSNDQVSGFGGNMFVHFYNFTDYISNAVCIRNSRFLRGNSKLGAGLGITLFIGTSVVKNVHRDCHNVVSVTNCSFNNNKAGAGSGLYIENLQQNHCKATFNISNSTFSHNMISPKKNRRTINDVGVAIAIFDGELNGVPWSRPRKTFSVALDNIRVEYNSMVILDYQS